MEGPNTHQPHALPRAIAQALDGGSLHVAKVLVGLQVLGRFGRVQEVWRVGEGGGGTVYDD